MDWERYAARLCGFLRHHLEESDMLSTKDGITVQRLVSIDTDGRGEAWVTCQLAGEPGTRDVRRRDLRAPGGIEQIQRETLGLPPVWRGR
jgi:hypothetical protein